MEGEGLISVVVIFHNAKEHLRQCVDSILSQDCPQDTYEIVLVDNGSTDGGPSLLNGYGKRTRLAFEGRIGHGCARNRGLSEAKGGIVAFIDSDCVADKGWLRSIAAEFSSSDVCAVAGEIKAYEPTTDVEMFYEEAMSPRNTLAWTPPYAVTANLAIRKSVAQDAGLFDEGLANGEDVDFSWRLFERGYAIKYSPRALVFHRNIKTKWQLFKKTIRQGFYSVKVVKKNVSILEKRGYLNRLYLVQYRELASGLLQAVLGRGLKPQTVMLAGKKIGVVAGSIRYGFFFI